MIFFHFPLQPFIRVFPSLLLIKSFIASTLTIHIITMWMLLIGESRSNLWLLVISLKYCFSWIIVWFFPLITKITPNYLPMILDVSPRINMYGIPSILSFYRNISNRLWSVQLGLVGWIPCLRYISHLGIILDNILRILFSFISVLHIHFLNPMCCYFLIYTHVLIQHINQYLPKKGWMSNTKNINEFNLHTCW